MRVKVEFYDILRELSGVHEWGPEIPSGATVGDLYALARLTFPRMASFPQQPVFTAGLDYVETTHVLQEAETISILPPPPRG